MEREWAVVVPGHSCRGRVSGRCRALLERAAELVEERPARVVVFSGWATWDGPSEAEQMLEAWPGRRDVELLAETTASSTAENAARSLPLLLQRGVAAATVVCAPLHAARVTYFFGGLYPQFGVRCEIRVARALPTPQALAREVAAAVVAPRQRRAALAELRALAR
ncbi:MAG TPA: YdcF family protein [Gaiellaceae bacterium]|nr:YdcF family protein [Gaiellaceae bacterium]